MENHIERDDNSNINIREQIEKYIVHWRWFLLSTIVTLILAFVYLRYAQRDYKINTTIIVKDERRGGGMVSEMAAFSDLAMFSGGKSNVENETQLLKSSGLAEKTVKRLQLNVVYTNEGRVKKTVLYDDSPLRFNFIEPVFDFEKIRYTFSVNSTGPDSFSLSDLNAELGTFVYGDTISTKLGKLIVTKNESRPIPTLSLAESDKEDDTDNAVDRIKVDIYPVSNVVDYFLKNLQVTPTDKFSSVIDLSLIDPTPSKAIDYLNTLVHIYNEDAVTDKRFVSEKTSEFISTRLELITKELSEVEKSVEGYKNVNQLSDIPTEVRLYLENASVYEKNIIENETELKVVISMIDFLRKSKSEDLLPSNIVTSDASAAGLINQYNTLVLERNRIFSSSTVENPAVIRLDSQIASMKASVLESLIRLKSTLEITKSDLAKKERELQSKLAQVPRQEREFRIIDRQQKVKEAIYLYLFQKREETAIALAATDLNAKVIDEAKAGNKPVSPKTNIILLAALMLGVLIPFAIIYLKDLLDTKIKSRLDIEGQTQVPFLGDIPHSDSHDQIIDISSRSSAAEAIRIIRTNLEFMLTHTPEGLAKTIFLTSTFPKEGKTFTSVNIAGTIALSSKRILLIGMDLRNPRLDDYISLPARGVSDFLGGKETDINTYITKVSGFDNFFALPAGTIPPNPAELLMGTKVEQMFAYLKTQYDYIVVDTAPVSLVTDTLLIAKHADTFIYVARANYLDKRLLKIPDTLYRENKLPNMSIVLNDTDTTKGYGYGYGYGYGQNMEKDLRPWWKKALNVK